jgi:hypothetical protein
MELVKLLSTEMNKELQWDVRPDFDSYRGVEIRFVVRMWFS